MPAVNHRFRNIIDNFHELLSNNYNKKMNINQFSTDNNVTCNIKFFNLHLVYIFFLITRFGLTKPPFFHTQYSYHILVYRRKQKQKGLPVLAVLYLMKKLSCTTVCTWWKMLARFTFSINLSAYNPNSEISMGMIDVNEILMLVIFVLHKI